MSLNKGFDLFKVFRFEVDRFRDFDGGIVCGEILRDYDGKILDLFVEGKGDVVILV
jgi:hypothetical protein